MNNMNINVPSLGSRIASVWYRHVKVYTKYFISNAFPPFLEPIMFLLGIGLGLGFYVDKIQGLPFIYFLSSGIVIPPAMFTAAYDCTFGTFIRMEFEKVYDGMLASSINYKDLLLGEILFAATKGAFFSLAVLIVITIFSGGQFPYYPSSFFIPIAGFFTGLMFAPLSLFVTSFVKTINHFNFYFTGLLTPLFFFSGIVFPLNRLPQAAQVVAEILPLTHIVRITRAFCLNQYNFGLILDWIYVFIFSAIMIFLSILRLKKRLLS